MTEWMDDLTVRMNQIEQWIYAPTHIPVILLGVGLLLTVMTGFVQVRRFPLAVRAMLAGRHAPAGGEGMITSFQALSTALAATVGNGNIGGVATAILVGGPGAIFWMWVCGTIGMATKFAEATLGVHYRVTRETGEMASGPMYYITRGIKNQALARPLAVAFAIFGTAAALMGTGNMAQSNTVAQTFMEAGRTILGVDFPAWVPGLLITVSVGLVLLGGVKRIAAVAEKLVPSMIVLYVVSAIAYIVLNVTHLPAVLGLILSHAFTPAAAMGGFVGASVAQAVAAGISRGVLSNEAGLGSSPIAHGVARVDHPVQQGLVGIVEVFIDTILVCSMTAFIILSSEQWQDPAYQAASGDLTAASLATSIPGATLIVALCSFLFGFSTLLGWSYYGEKCAEFLLGPRVVVPYRILFTILILVGAVIAVPLVWAIGTLLNAFMALPNLIGLFLLAGVVRRLANEYFARSAPREQAGRA